MTLDSGLRRNDGAGRQNGGCGIGKAAANRLTLAAHRPTRRRCDAGVGQAVFVH